MTKDFKSGLVKWIEVDLARILGNARALRREMGEGINFLAAVKTNAYGHGLEEISRTLVDHGVCGSLGVWSLEEAWRLWRLGFKQPAQVMILTPTLHESSVLAPAVKKGAWFLLDRFEMVRLYAQAARMSRSRIKVFLDIDLGLGRWGASPAQALNLARQTLKEKNIDLIGLSAHIDYVPGLNKTEAALKLERFSSLAGDIERLAGRSLVKTCANSSVFLDFPSWRFNMVRLGNLLYGINQTKADFPVQSAWQFKARILSIRSIVKGETVGYGSEYVAPRAMRAASVACGFADGLTMEPAQRTIRLVSPDHYYARGEKRRYPIIGRVGLGHALLDVTQDRGVAVGDIVSLPVRRTAAPMDVARIYLK